MKFKSQSVSFIVLSLSVALIHCGGAPSMEAPRESLPMDAEEAPPTNGLGAKVALGVAATVGTFVAGHLAADCLEFFGDIQVWDQTKMTGKCYDEFERILPVGMKFDYSEPRYSLTRGGEFHREWTSEFATANKYDYIFNAVGLSDPPQPGTKHKVLEAGGGNGIFATYLSQKGVKVTGLTLSPEQARVANEKKLEGVEFVVADYRVFNPNWVGQYKAVTALGSSEHVCQSVGSLATLEIDGERHNAAAYRCNAQRIDTWNNFGQYITDDGRIYITMLVVNDEREWSATDWAQALLLNRTYGGYYSKWSDIKNVVIPGLDDLEMDGEEEDLTADYHWGSMSDPRHFGNWKIEGARNWMAHIWDAAKRLPTDPHVFHRLGYHKWRTWMWQFGGETIDPLTADQVKNAPMHLKAFALKKKQR